MQRAFSQAPRFLPTFTTATGLVGIDTERARELRELEAPKPKPKPVNVTKRLQGFKWRGSSNAISADVDAWLRGTPAFPASGATMNCFEAVIVDVVAVSKLVSKADVLEAIDAARNKPLRALSGLLTVLGWDSAAPVGSDDELRKGDVLFFAEGPTEIAHVVRYVRKNEEGHHLVRSHWTKPDGQGYRVVRLDKLREYHEIQDAQMSVSSTRRSV